MLLLRTPKSECPDVWIRLPRQKWPKSWSDIEDPVVLRSRKFYGHPLAGLLRERQFGEVLLELEWETVPNWVFLFTEHKDYYYYYQYTWVRLKWLERSRIWLPCGRNWWNIFILTNPTSFLDHVYLGCTQRKCTPNEDIVNQKREMFWITNFCWCHWKVSRLGNQLAQRRLRGPSTWKGMHKKCVERHCELANKKIEQ